MALIIKGKMPKGISKNCCYCGYARGGDWNDTCGITNNIIDVGFCAPKQKDCPVIGKIPDKHGDLIDRDALLNELKKHYKIGEVAEVAEVACFIEEAEVVLEANK